MEPQHDFSTEIALLKRDVSTFDKYFNKIDQTLDKLADATTQITKMIALHDERLEQAQEDTSEMKALIEQRRQETHSNLDDLEKKIDAHAERLTSTERSIVESIQVLKNELLSEMNKTKTASETRIKKLELWRYLVIGGSLVVLYFLGQFTQSYFDNWWQQQLQSPPVISQPLNPQK